MYITFRSQRGIGQVAKEMSFGKDITFKFACLDAGEGERWSIISEAQLKTQFPKIFKNVNCRWYKPFALSLLNLMRFCIH